MHAVIPALDIYIEGVAATKGSWRSVNTKRGHRLIPDNPDEQAWSQLIAWHARAKLKNAEPTKLRYAVHIVCELPHRAGRKSFNRDADKLARSALDSLSGVLYADDEQVDRLVVDKYRGDVPGMRIRAWEYEPNPTRIFERMQAMGDL